MLGDCHNSYCFTEFLHRFIPGQKLFKYIRICQEGHTWQYSEKQLKILENIKSVCFGSFYYAVDIGTCFSSFGSITEQPVLTVMFLKT